MLYNEFLKNIKHSKGKIFSERIENTIRNVMLHYSFANDFQILIPVIFLHKYFKENEDKILYLIWLNEYKIYSEDERNTYSKTRGFLRKIFDVSKNYITMFHVFITFFNSSDISINYKLIKRIQLLNSISQDRNMYQNSPNVFKVTQSKDLIRYILEF